MYKMGEVVSRGWTDSEDAILREYYPIGGGKLCVAKGVTKKLSTIRMRAKKLGIHSKNTVWSDAELNVLYSMHETNTLNAISNKLKGRSPKAIKKKLDELGLECVVKWSDEDIAILKEYYPKGGSKLVKRKGVDKPTNLIASKANSMGLKLNVSRVSWSDAEVEILIKYYGIEGMNVLKRLPGKNRLSVINKLNTINTYYREKYSYWSAEDKRLLIENKDKPIEELVVILNQRSKEDIEDLVSYYRWKYVNNNVYTRWSEEEIDFLIANYGVYDISDLQKMGLRKSRSAIYNKVNNLGLSKRSYYKSWTEEEINILKENYGSTTTEEICMLLPNKTIGAIKCRASLLGLSKGCSVLWSDAELDILTKYFSEYGASRVLNELKQQLGVANRTEIAIYKKAVDMGLRHK